MERTAEGLRFTLAGAAVEALAEGGLWLVEPGALIVSDLHLEKGSAFAARGQLLPPYDTATTLARLAGLIAARRPRRVVSLGDSFHDGEAMARMSEPDRRRLQALVAATDWLWIAGNHDPTPPEWLGGRSAAAVEIAGLQLRHEPTPGAGHGEVAGHLHPCARVAGRGRSVRARCFVTDGRRLIMPAFGAYAGGLNACAPAVAGLFAEGFVALTLGQGGVHPAPQAALTLP